MLDADVEGEGEGKWVEGFMSGIEEREGGGTPSGYVWFVERRDAWGLVGSVEDEGDVVLRWDVDGDEVLRPAAAAAAAVVPLKRVNGIP